MMFVTSECKAAELMPMPAYPIYCYSKSCKNLACFKIAAHWSDGVQRELKTYALTCADCLATWFETSRRKQLSCRLTAGEILEPPGIYQLQHGQRDQQLQRLADLEKA